MRSVATRITERVSAVIVGQVAWDFRLLGGDPAHALSRLADECDARLIVVGGVRKGISHELEDLLSGSIAASLTRLQQRPVLVVPDDHTSRKWR
ncbi:universal stress protein [Paramicrobacterium humi]|uniref:universal stress protein n=1 Tax=Paramicrobacterium humi TaxID=640635 RepID=UPI000B83796E|nr:universal stress protein [Microbacterium humi]